jgi:hypothetical protein
VRHLLDGVVNLTSDDGTYPQCGGVDRYFHPNLRTIQAMGLKWSTTVDGNRPIVAEVNEWAQQHSWEARAVSAYGPMTTVLTEGAVGVVNHVHL